MTQRSFAQSQALSPCNRQRLRLIIHKHSSLEQSESRRPAKHAGQSSSATTQVTVSVVCVPGVRMSDKKVATVMVALARIAPVRATGSARRLDVG